MPGEFVRLPTSAMGIVHQSEGIIVDGAFGECRSFRKVWWLGLCYRYKFM